MRVANWKSWVNRVQYFFTKRVGCNSRSRFEYASVVHRIQFPGNEEEALESFVLPRRSGTSVTSALPRGTFDKIFRNRVSVIILWLSSPACIRHWPLLSTLSYCSRRTNLAEATLDLHAESIWRSKRNRCIVHVWRERRFNFSVWNSLFYTRSIALWILEKVWKRFFAIQILGRFFLYFLSIEGIERKIYDALENFVIVI